MDLISVASLTPPRGNELNPLCVHYFDKNQQN